MHLRTAVIAITIWYGLAVHEILKKTFEEIEGYDEMIVLRGILL
jgi:flagellar biosynthesis regulator FlaF